MSNQERRDAHYARVSHAFDRAAQSYDALYQANPIMAWMRRENLTTVKKIFAPGDLLLEIGCGTGDEALALARDGYKIVAIDISAAMIEAAQAKSGTDTDGVTWLTLPAGQLDELIRDYGPNAFDGAYASFGALNCEPDLVPVVTALAELLRPSAAWVCSVMNRWCAWEIGWGLLHLRPRQALRRLSRDGWVAAGLASPESRLSVPTRFYSPRGFAHLCAPHFKVRQVYGLPVLLPPPYLAHLFERYPALFAHAQQLERRLRNRFPFQALGDHFLAVLERV